MIRLLCKDDLAVVNELHTQKRKKFAGLSPEANPYDMRLDESSRLISYYLAAPNPSFRGYGYFHDGLLSAVMLTCFSGTSCSWILNKMLSRTERVIGAPVANGLAALMSHSINYAESRGVYKYYVCFPKEYLKAHDRLWSTNVSERARYDIFIEGEIPANTRPPYNEWWLLMMGGSLWPADMMVKLHVLRQEFRHE